MINTKDEEIKGMDKYSLRRTKFKINQSDMVSILRGKLEELQLNVKKAIIRQTDQESKYHLKDIYNRISQTLNPEK